MYRMKRSSNVIPIHRHTVIGVVHSVIVGRRQPSDQNRSAVIKALWQSRRHELPWTTDKILYWEILVSSNLGKSQIPPLCKGRQFAPNARERAHVRSKSTREE